MAADTPKVHKGQGPGPLTQEQQRERFYNRFQDPEFAAYKDELKRIAAASWKAYGKARKAPRTVKAGPGFHDPNYQISVEWLAARDAIAAAQKRHDDRNAPRRILLVIGSPRNDKTCPGEASKTFRLAATLRGVFEAAHCDCDVLDLSHLTSQYERTIYPCKACVSTAMPLCHWPCSCYPNHALGQVNDWMNEIYPRWVAAHGVCVVTPVHWLSPPTVLKSLMDRLVCADGGNPDPTRTHGKDPEAAKKLELQGWDYPRHLKGRAFGVVVHGDTEGAELVRRSVTEWLAGMELVQAGGAAVLDRYIGYYEPYATSHQSMDKDAALLEEVRNVGRSLVRAVEHARKAPGEAEPQIRNPRPK